LLFASIPKKNPIAVTNCKSNPDLKMSNQNPQDIFNVNPFGDFATHFNGKSQEITEIVKQQQQTANDFCNNLLNEAAQAIAPPDFNLMSSNDENETNNLNNNKLNEIDDDVVMASDVSDTNNNSNSQFDADFGPETDVDAIEPEQEQELEDETKFDAGEKEKAQFETKETEDFPDRGAIDEPSANPFDAPQVPAFASFENKIFEELSLHNPDLIKGNPFTEIDESGENLMVPNDEFIDNKLIDDFKEEMSCEMKEEKKDFGFEDDGFEKDSRDVELESATEVVNVEIESASEEFQVQEKIEEPIVQG
jgi:hypothetical protein